MSHFSVFNIGSGHTVAEPNQTIGVLGKECSVGGGSRHKILTDGVLTAFGGYAGYFTSRLETNVDAILKGNQPMYIPYPHGGITQNFCSQPLRSGDTVNLTGHSRGAVMCHLIANRLAESVNFNRLTINIIVLDPVNMTKKYGKDSGVLNANACTMLGEYRVIAMANEGKGALFPLKTIELADPRHIGKIKPLTMPGTHGTGTSCLTTKVGKACLEMIRYYMSRWGTGFNSPVISDNEFCDLFADVHLEILNVNKPNKVMVGGKAVDFSKKRSTAIQQQWLENKDWVKAREALGKRPYGVYFPESYFINRFHENRFRDVYHVDSVYDVIRKKVPLSQKVENSINRYLNWRGYH